MKKSIISFAILAVLLSCKQNKETQETEKKLSIAEKIANANGFEHWKNVSEIQFTFNIMRDTTQFGRSWQWNPKTDAIVMISGKDTIAYNRNAIDSTSINADKAFINDKYWMLAPFQLMWDNLATISEISTSNAPVSNDEYNKITLTYPHQGGYTPGDAYDFYFDEDYIIREWSYRKGNAPEPTLSSTWEDYEDFNGIKISKTRQQNNPNWKLYFTNIKVVN